jgi:hypothetical protein
VVTVHIQGLLAEYTTKQLLQEMLDEEKVDMTQRGQEEQQQASGQQIQGMGTLYAFVVDGVRTKFHLMVRSRIRNSDLVR